MGKYHLNIFSIARIDEFIWLISNPPESNKMKCQGAFYCEGIENGEKRKKYKKGEK